MIRLPPFEYLAPHSLEEAVAMKAEHGPEAMYVAGGTDLYPKMKRRQLKPKVLIGLRSVSELYRVSNGNPAAVGWMKIGAAVTLAKVVSHAVINQRYPALARAAGLVSSSPLRNIGTIGGNLCVDTRCTYYDQSYAWRKALGFCMKKDGDICWVALSSPRCMAVSSSDCAPVAIALGAQARLLGPDGERTLPVAALYADDGMDYLSKSPDELLVEIQLPPLEGWRMAYWKLRRRRSIDFPVLGVAVALRIGEAGVCTEARLVLGAVASQPLLVPEAADMLVGQAISPELIQEVAGAAYKFARPLDNTDIALGYRKKMGRVFIAGALSEAMGFAGKV